MDNIKGTFEDYISNQANKLYYGAFAILKPSKLSSKRNHIDRVYFEIKGCSLYYWIAGHCDTNPGSISRLKLSTDFSIIPIFNFVPDFKRSIAKGDAVEPGCFCFSSNVPGTGDDAWGILLNHSNGKETINSYKFCFNNYPSCSKFFSAINLALCEYHWIQMQYTNAVIGSLNDNPGSSLGPPTKGSRLFDMYLIKVNGAANVEWTQFYVSFVIKKVKKEGYCVNVALYEDESRKKQVAVIERFSEVYLEIMPDMTLRNNMNGFVMKDCVLKKKTSKSRIKFQPFINELLFVSCNDNQLVQWLTLMHDTAKYEDSSPFLKQIILPIPDKLPNTAASLFLDLSDVTVDMLFQTKQESFKTLQSLFKAKEIAFSRALQLKQEKRKSRLSMGNYDMMTDSSNDKNNSQGSKNAENQTGVNSTKDKRKSRISIYFKDLKEDNEPSKGREALKANNSANSINTNSTIISKNSSIGPSIDTQGAYSHQSCSSGGQRSTFKGESKASGLLNYSNSESSGHFFSQPNAATQSALSIKSGHSADAATGGQYLASSNSNFARNPHQNEAAEAQDGLFGNNVIAPPPHHFAPHGYQPVERMMATPIASGYVPYDQIPSTPLNSYYRQSLYHPRYPYQAPLPPMIPPYCPTPYYYPGEGGAPRGAFYSADFPMHPHYGHDFNQPPRPFYQMPQPSMPQFMKATFSNNDEMLAANAQNFLSHSQYYDGASQQFDGPLKSRDPSSSTIFTHASRPFPHPNASQAIPPYFGNLQSNTSFVNRPIPPPQPPNQPSNSQFFQ